MHTHARIEAHKYAMGILYLQGEESHKADEYIRYIKDKMPDAILQCTEAAGAEFEASLQKSLLRVRHLL